MSAGTSPDADRGLSPVIAVVLLIAIVVVLAGVLSAGVLNLGQNPQDVARGGASIDWNEDDQAGQGSVEITYLSSGNTERIEVNYEVLTDPSNNGVSVESGSTVMGETGQSVTLSEDASNADDDIRVKVIVVGYTADGEKTVLTQETESI